MNGTSFSIGQNLFDLLEQISMSPNALRDWLWIDALCVNQSDEYEKSDQVNHMDETFASSAWTLVWLGKACESTEHVLFLLEHVKNEEIERVRKIFDGDITYDSINPESVHHQKHEFNDLVWLELMFSCSRTWFRRVWTLQEAALAPSVSYLCGSLPIQQDVVMEANDLTENVEIQRWLEEKFGYYTLQSMKLVSPAGLHAQLTQIWREHTNDGTDSKIYFKAWYNVPGASHSAAALLVYVLFGPVDYDSTDARDRVFALLGIAKRAGTSVPIEPNYSKSVTEVCTETMGAILHETRSLVPLLHSSANSTLRRELPSWVPDFGALKGLTLL